MTIGTGTYNSQQKNQKWLLAPLVGSSLGGINTTRAQEAAVVGEAGDPLTEIVVTARKRSENLIDTPVSHAGVTNMVGLAGEVPQLHMGTLFFGKNSPAGVIAVNSKGPTDSWQAPRRRATSSSLSNQALRRHSAVRLQPTPSMGISRINLPREIWIQLKKNFCR